MVEAWFAGQTSIDETTDKEGNGAPLKHAQSITSLVEVAVKCGPRNLQRLANIPNFHGLVFVHGFGRLNSWVVRAKRFSPALPASGSSGVQARLRSLLN